MSDPFFLGGGKSKGGSAQKRSAGGAGLQRRGASSSSSSRAMTNPAARKPQRSTTSTRKGDDLDDEAGEGKGDDEDDEVGFGGIDEMDLMGDYDPNAAPDTDDEEKEEEDRETPAQKRLRLAKKYLEKLNKPESTELAFGEFDAKDVDRDLIAERLRDDALEAKGKLYHMVANKYADIDFTDSTRIRSFRGVKRAHQLSLTSVSVACPPEKGPGGLPLVYIFTASKDAAIAKWNLLTGVCESRVAGGIKPTKRAKRRKSAKALSAHVGHNDQILCLATSSDGKFVATGGRDKAIHIWSVKDMSHFGVFTQHRDTVSGLAFRVGRSNQLYSCSHDRTIKLWNVDELTYIETLFGHQDQIQHIDTLSLERCLSAGARDRTVRLWKIVDESQLVFRGGGGTEVSDIVSGTLLPSELEENKKESKKSGGIAFGGSIDVVALVDEEHFVSGTDNGAISLWNLGRKKPIYTRLRAHGPENIEGGNEFMLPSNVCRWIVSLATLRYSDIFASGSCDGFVRLWKLSGDKKSFTPLNKIPMVGFINSLQFFEAPPLPENLDEILGQKEGTESEETFALNTAAGRRAAAFKAMATPKQAKALYLAIATGQEHRLGRWWKVNEAKNEVKVVTLG
ncbi:pre-rRNA processing protein [Blyttiomyces sp. JEL0837]|nr:pre-rRNA processing protein [Blyttiomyces sp. JEL0837]